MCGFQGHPRDKNPAGPREKKENMWEIYMGHFPLHSAGHTMVI